jgi:hypothetical protein
VKNTGMMTIWTTAGNIRGQVCLKKLDFFRSYCF